MRDINVADGVLTDEMTREMAISPYRDYIAALAKQHPAEMLPLITKARGRGADIVADETIDAVRRATEREVMAIATRALKTASASITPYLREACKTKLSAAAARVFSEKKSRGIEAATLSRGGALSRAKRTLGGLVLMAACQVDQVASVIYAQNDYHSAFTYFVNKVLVQDGFSMNRELSYSHIMLSVTEMLHPQHRTQSRGDVSAGNLLGLSNLTLAETLGMSALRSAGSTLTLSKAFSAGRQDSRTVSSVLTSAYYGALASTFNDLHTTRAMDLGETLHVVAKHATTVLLGAVVQSRPCDSLRDLAARLVNEANPYPLREKQLENWFMCGVHQHFYEALVSLMRLKELIPPDATMPPESGSSRGSASGTYRGTCQPPPKRLYDLELCPELLKHTSPTIRNFYSADLQDSRAPERKHETGGQDQGQSRDLDQGQDQDQDQGEGESQDKGQCKWQGQGSRQYQRQVKGQRQWQGDREFPYDGQSKGECQCDDQGQGQCQDKGQDNERGKCVVSAEITVDFPERNAKLPNVRFNEYESEEWVFNPALVYRCVADLVYTGLPGLECPISYEIWLAWSRIAGKALLQLKQPSEQERICPCPQPQPQPPPRMNDEVWDTLMRDTTVLLLSMRNRSPAIHLWRHLLKAMEIVKLE
eukprot:m51a1_g12808 hypothetical protein (650) ;mRNA; f:347-3501